MPIEHINESDQTAGLQRRTVLKGAAWAVPVVAAAVAVPMAAASVTQLLPSTSLGFGYNVAEGTISSESAVFGVTAVGTSGGSTELSSGPLQVEVRFPSVYSSVNVVESQDLGNGWVVLSVTTSGSFTTVTVYHAAGIKTSEPGYFTIPSFTTPIVASVASPPSTIPSPESVRVRTSWPEQETSWGNTSYWPNEED